MIRGIGLRGAIAVNVITMIGIGPLITIPLVLNQLHGSLALAAWIAGALIALCDGLIWAELGSRYPGSGGTYVFLREAFGRERLGRMLAFLFTWQTVLSIPLLLASGYIGFAHYAAYLWPPLSAPMLQGVVAAAVALVTVVLLYRPIGNIAKTSVVLASSRSRRCWSSSWPQPRTLRRPRPSRSIAMRPSRAPSWPAWARRW
jgi:amino acid transporter